MPPEGAGPPAGANATVATGAVRPGPVYLTVLVIATCGLVYELLASTLASYVLGDAVTQYSTVIGVYLSAMGLGAWLSGHVVRGVARRFVEVEIAVALVGGTSAPVLFFAFAHLSWFRLALYLVVLAIGTLVGLEVPLLLRILKGRYELKDLVARVLTVDYAGALVGSLAFPIFFVPKLGLVRTSLVLGAVNAATALASTWMLRDEIVDVRALRAKAIVVLALLLGGAAYAERMTMLAEEGLYSDELIFSRQTPYQRIALTRGRGSFQLFLNGNLQFSSADEYRYHEALVWPALAARAEAGRKTESVLVLGGGDGLALRELERSPDVRAITLVDLDPEMPRLGRALPLIRELNGGSFDDARVTLIAADAYVWLDDAANGARRFDAIVADFPDPNHYSLGKLYTTHIYRQMRAHLSEGGVLVVQSTSPMFARKSYWCIARTMEKAGLSIAPYHAFVPSFGEWGYVLASAGPLKTPTHLPPSKAPFRYLDDATLTSLFVLSVDMQSVPVEINRLDNQVLVHYYDDEWKRLL
ncbi:MAG: polyamine aminopropyltransferase [Polyangiales bacterium]